MPTTRAHLPDLSDEELFALAAEACSRFRRFAAYGMLLYLPMAAMALTLVKPPTAAAVWMGMVTGVLGVALLFASLGLRRSPRICARVILGCLVPFLPMMLFAAGGYLLRPAVWRSENPRPQVRILDEVAARLDRNPEGTAQRAWLGY